MKTIRNLCVPPQMKVMIHKLINNALYMGEVANKYQRLIKQLPAEFQYTNLFSVSFQYLSIQSGVYTQIPQTLLHS